MDPKPPPVSTLPAGQDTFEVPGTEPRSIPMGAPSGLSKVAETELVARSMTDTPCVPLGWLTYSRAPVGETAISAGSPVVGIDVTRLFVAASMTATRALFRSAT